MSGADVELTLAQALLLREALGLNEDGSGSCTRRHWLADEGSQEAEDCMAMCRAGLMWRREGTWLTGWKLTFTAFPAALAVARKRHPEEVPVS